MATVLDARFEALGVSDESAVVMFALAGTGSRRRLDNNFSTLTAQFGLDGWAQVNDDRLPATDCLAACEIPVGMRSGMYFHSNGHALVSTVYIAAYDVDDPKIEITTPGWTMRPWQPGWRSVTMGNARGSTTISAFHRGIGTYRGARLQGGRYGSVASAGLPCGSRGTGGAVLTGGSRRLEMECGGYEHAFDIATRVASWRVAGEVTGDSWKVHLLIVVDLPRG